MGGNMKSKWLVFAAGVISEVAYVSLFVLAGLLIAFIMTLARS